MTPNTCSLQELPGSVAVITGGAGGIGFAVAEECVRRGIRVVLADIHQQSLEVAVTALGKENAWGHVTDVADWQSVEALRDAVHERHHAISLLFCNAGVGTGSSVTAAGLKDWSLVLGVNLMGTVHCVRAFVPSMKDQLRPGRIAITASMVGITSLQTVAPPWSSAPYNVSKVGVVAVAEELVKELRHYPHLSCHVLCPGVVGTNIIQNSAREAGRGVRASTVQSSTIPDVAYSQAVTQYYAENGLAPSAVVSALFAAIEDGRFYVPVEDGSHILELAVQRHHDLQSEGQPSPVDLSPFLRQLKAKADESWRKAKL